MAEIDHPASIVLAVASPETRTFITVRPDTGVLDVQMKKLPMLGAGNLACDVVAGARYEPVQIELKPVERFVAGLRAVA